MKLSSPNTLVLVLVNLLKPITFTKIRNWPVRRLRHKDVHALIRTDMLYRNKKKLKKERQKHLQTKRNPAVLMMKKKPNWQRAEVYE